MDSMSLSLDEIIKKNKIVKPGNKKKPAVKGGMIIKKTIALKTSGISPKKNLDARMKIIQKNRRKINDAREKITENARRSFKDARELITSKKPALKTKKFARNPNNPKVPRSQLNMDDEDLLMNDDDIELVNLDKFNTKPIGSLRRTVKNDNYRSSSPPLRGMPKLPTFSIQNRETSPSADPFDCYIVPNRRPAPLPPRNLTERFQASKIMSAHMDAYIKDEPARKSILRSTRGGDEHDDRFESDRYVVAESSSSRNRYKINESAGIFANLASPPRNNSGMIKGYRIIVNNLDTGVTEGEMRELFSDIGDVLSSKIIRPGTAEIIYRNQGDDNRAHEAYHNRVLDGLPMKILLTGSTSKSASYYRM